MTDSESDHRESAREKEGYLPMPSPESIARMKAYLNGSNSETPSDASSAEEVPDVPKEKDDDLTKEDREHARQAIAEARKKIERPRE